MLETGNWLVPTTLVGEPRLQKPIAAYWMSASGMTLLGTSALGGRIAWIIAAALLLLAIYRLARVAKASRSQALLAQALSAGSYTVMVGATSAIPDLPLTLFLTIAGIGFAGVLCDAPDTHRRHAWTFWIGVALAVVTKGLLPVAFASTALTFVAVRRPERLREFAAPPAVGTAATLALTWYVVIAVHLGGGLDVFFHDQIAKKFTPDLGHVAGTFLIAILFVLIAFTPMVLVLVLAGRSAVTAFSTAKERDFAHWAILWTLVVCAVFSFSAWLTTRYFLPVVPFLSVVLAAVLTEIWQTSRRLRQVVLAGIAGLTFALCCTALFTTMQMGAPADTVWVLLASLVTMIVLARQRNSDFHLHRLCLAPLGWAVLVWLAMQPIVMPAKGVAIARAIEGVSFSQNSLHIVGRDELAVVIMLEREEPIPVQMASDLDPSNHCGARAVVVETAIEASTLRACGFEVEALEYGWRVFGFLDVGELIAATHSFSLADKVSARRGTVFLACRHCRESN